MLLWEELLCSETIKEKEITPTSWVDYPMDPMEQDYREIIASSCFRLLQDKSQVYQLKKGDYVRTRLTHSLEVSTIAKQLGIMMIYNEKWNYIPCFSELNINDARAIPTVLASAGLLHDIGNPPFGHEGEYAISKWFLDHWDAPDFVFFGKPVRSCLNEQMREDLSNFDGNAQVIRLLSKENYISEEFVPNVSLATISALIKYPLNSLQASSLKGNCSKRKFGYFVSETDTVASIQNKTGLAAETSAYKRNPLACLLEAADDIAYVTSDIEDAVSKGTFTVAQLLRFMEEQVAMLPETGDERHQMQVLTAKGIVRNLKKRLEECSSDDESDVMAVLVGWANYLRNWLMYVTAGSFIENWEAIMDGNFACPLLDAGLHKYTIRILKKAMYTFVYPSLADIHLSAYNILGDLMDRFCKAVIYWDTPREPDPYERCYIEMILERYKRVYFAEKTEDENYNLYLRFRMVIDFISGLSDGHALELYQQINAFSY